MKYIRLFNNIQSATTAEDLVAPNVTLVHDNDGSKLLHLGGVTDTPLEIVGSTLNDLAIQEKMTGSVLLYTTSDGNPISSIDTTKLDATISSNTYSGGQGTIQFDGVLTEIDGGAFYNCSNLSTVILPEGVTRVGTYCGEGGDAVQIVLAGNAFPAGITLTLPATLDEVYIHDGLDDVGEWKYPYTSNSTTVIFPEGRTNLDCAGIIVAQHVQLPNSLTNISNTALFSVGYSGRYFGTETITCNGNTVTFPSYGGDHWSPTIVVELANGTRVTLTVGDYQCLTGDTLVTMADGTVRRIDNVFEGEYVLAYDKEQQKYVGRKVIYTDKDDDKTHTEYDKWTFDDGTIIKTVHEHEFYNATLGHMEYMSKWNIGDKAYKLDGTTPTLISHETIHETVKHYKITLEGGTAFFANNFLNGDREERDFTMPLDKKIDVILNDETKKRIISRITKNTANIVNPKTITDKLAVLQYNYSGDSDFASYEDKFKIKNKLNELNLSSFAIPMIKHYETVEDFKKDFNSLVKPFVIKVNCGRGIYKITETDDIDLDKLCGKIQRAMHSFEGVSSAKQWLEEIQPVIMVEELIPNTDYGFGSHIDYRLYCFNGNPSFFVVNYKEKTTGNIISKYMSADWKQSNIYTVDKNVDIKLEKPDCINDIISCAKEISKDLHFCRVDFIISDNHPYLSEVTISPICETMKFNDALKIDAGRKLTTVE